MPKTNMMKSYNSVCADFSISFVTFTNYSRRFIRLIHNNIIEPTLAKKWVIIGEPNKLHPLRVYSLWLSPSFKVAFPVAFLFHIRTRYSVCQALHLNLDRSWDSEPGMARAKDKKHFAWFLTTFMALNLTSMPTPQISIGNFYKNLLNPVSWELFMLKITIPYVCISMYLFEIPTPNRTVKWLLGSLRERRRWTGALNRLYWRLRFRWVGARMVFSRLTNRRICWFGWSIRVTCLTNMEREKPEEVVGGV